MINDMDIDLTPAGKFTVPRWGRSRTDAAYDKLFVNRNKIGYPSIIKRSSLLPWNERNDNITSLERRYKRHYKDWLSDDFGITLRLTSDNTFMTLGDRIVCKDVLEEYLLETIGYLPYESVTFCIDCFKKGVTSLKNKNAWVSCKFHRMPKIPWQSGRYRVE